MKVTISNTNQTACFLELFIVEIKFLKRVTFNEGIFRICLDTVYFVEIWKFIAEITIVK